MENVYGWDINPQDSKNYVDICESILENEETFFNFKSLEQYNSILEHVDFDLGQDYFNHIQEFGKEIYEQYFDRFLENDIIGNPRQFFYEDKKISPTTLRYIKTTLDLSSLCGDQKISKIVEVGGGYGGLCKTLSVLCDFKKYLIVDLPQTVKVQKKYLKHFEVHSKLEFIPCNEIDDISDVDLFISNYALSELNIETQLNYYDKIIKNSKVIYITYNLITNNAVDNYNIIVSKLEEDGFQFEKNYCDYGGHKNIIIAGKK